MVDVGGAANLIVAVIELARRDAVEPKGCTVGQRDWLRRDAQEFVQMIDEICVDLLTEQRIPYGRPCRQRGRKL